MPDSAHEALSRALMPLPDPAVTRPPLFRPEVLQAAQSQWLGSIRVGRPPGFMLVTCGALALAGALAAFAAWGEVTRKATVHGMLLPAGGLINVSAPQAGVVADVLVSEGTLVQAGQPLMRLVSERITAAGDASAIQTQALQARRASLETERRLTEQSLTQRLDSAAQRQQSLQAEERQAMAELETHHLRLQLAQKTLERHQQLARDGFVAAAQVQQREEELLDLQLRERNAQRNLQALQRDLQSVHADRQALATQAQTALAQIDRNLAALREEAADAEGRHGVVITAPQAGRISALLLASGQAVQPAQTVLSLVPATQAAAPAADAAELQAHLFAPSRTFGFVRPGQTVWLRYAAFPYQKFGMARGEVIAISRSPIAPADLPVAAQATEPMFRITARLPAQHLMAYGQPTPLAAGMRLDADIQQDRRRVWEWLLEPVLAIARSRAT